MTHPWLRGERGWNLLGWSCCVLQVVTLVAVTVADEVDPARVLPSAAAWFVILLAAGALVVKTIDSGREFPTLVWPILGCAMYATFGLVAPAATALLPGMVTLCFAYIGLTQRRWTSCWFLLIGIPAFLIGADVSAQDIATVLPLLVLMWLFIGEVPAFLMHKLRAQAAQLETLARTDSLTGLLNRTVLVADLPNTSADDVVVVIDIDGFKAQNDRLGHVTGDALLARLARTLTDVSRDDGTWFRYGGDEFVGIFRQCTTSKVDQILEAVRDEARRSQPAIEFSAGRAPGGSRALENADAELYRAKNAR